MNRFKTYLLIPVLVFQISFLLPDLSRDLLQLRDNNGEPSQKISRDSSLHPHRPANDIHPFSAKETQCSGRAFAGKGMPQSDAVQAKAVEKKKTNSLSEGDSGQKQYHYQKLVLISEIGAGNAELF